MEISAVYFLSDADNLIDWVRASGDDPWQATNLGESTTQGAELGVGGAWDAVRWNLAYRFTDVDAESGGLESKYALNVPEHDVGLTLGMAEVAGYRGVVTLRYRDVPTLDRYWLLGLTASRRMGPVTLHVSGRNLLDEEYQEIPGVPTAGAYGEIGVEVAWP
jgi:outer membrane cobalamin receptor